jgi:hypothetical protein
VNNKDTSDINDNEVEAIGISFCKKLFGEDTYWVQTSYNSNFRKKYAEIGGIWRPDLDSFVSPCPFPSWILNETTCEWESPIGSPPKLTKEEILSKSFYVWDEKLYQENNTEGWTLIISMPKPFESWILNETTGMWESPIGPAPKLTEQEMEYSFYNWKEETGEWVLETFEEHENNNTNDDDNLI